jgi:hypothetical protein
LIVTYIYKLEKSKPFLEYDEEGNLIDSDDENTDIVVKYS